MPKAVVVLLVLCVGARAAEPGYSKDIAPLLADRCGGCHLSKVKMGGLSLETYDGLMQGGSTGKAVIPRQAKESRMYLMITGDVTPAMPMNSKRLSLAQMEMIREWIDAGAKGPTPGDAPQPALQKPLAKSLSFSPKAGFQPQIFDLAYSPDGSLLALASYKTVRLVNPATRESLGELTGHEETVRSVSFSRDGTLLAAAGGLPGRSGEVRIWDVAKRALKTTIRGHSDCVYAVAFSPDGKIVATTGYDRLVKLWDPSTGKEIRSLKDHIDAVYALAFTPDGRRLISGSADRTVKIWNVASGERLYTLSDAQDGIATLAVDPQGRFLAAGGLDKSIRIWELGEKSGKLVGTLIAHEDAILKLAWSPDGKRLLSSSADRTVKLFEVPELTEVAVYPQADWVYGLQWAPDSKSFAIGRFDGTWEVK